MATINLPPGFAIHGVTNKLLGRTRGGSPEVPDDELADDGFNILEKFDGIFIGNGFNTIFRPHSTNPDTPTTFPTPPQGPNDNILELNLTQETLAFDKTKIGDVPNRGLLQQADITLKGVPYVQTIQDISNVSTGKADGNAIDIHFEPGLWMRVPNTDTNPVNPNVTLNRMASIPHGTTINAQGVAPTGTTDGPPQIPAVDITPFTIQGSSPVPFPSQTLTSNNTFRIPQDLTLFNNQGTITQEILNDPNTVLRKANDGKKIKNTATIQITTGIKAPGLGGGTDNIDFLVGNGKAPSTTNSDGPNAQAVLMDATFWVSEVSHDITVPAHTPDQGPLTIAATSPVADAKVPSFIVDPQVAITEPKTITVTSTQIQYSQRVILNFAPLGWPHVSVATLVPRDPIKVPDSVFS